MWKAEVYAARPQVKALHQELLALPRCQLHGTVSVLLKVKKCMRDDREDRDTIYVFSLDYNACKLFCKISQAVRL